MRQPYLALRQVFPFLPEPPAGSEPRALSSSTKQEILDTLEHEPAAMAKVNKARGVNAIFDIIFTAIGGAFVEIAQQAYQRNSIEELQNSDFNDVIRKNSDLIFASLVCSIASAAVGMVRNSVDHEFFQGTSIAQSLQKSVSCLTNQQIEDALNHCIEGNLKEIKTPNPFLSNLISFYQYEGSYASALAISNAIPVTEEEKYFLLAASKITTSFLVSLCEKEILRDRLPEVQLFDGAFLRNFSPEEQTQIGKSLVKELQKCRGYSKDGKDFVMGAAITFSFLGVLSQDLISSDATDLASQIQASGENFAIASFVANCTRLCTTFLRDKMEENSQTNSGVEILIPDLEIDGDSPNDIEASPPNSTAEQENNNDSNAITSVPRTEIQPKDDTPLASNVNNVISR